MKSSAVKSPPPSGTHSKKEVHIADSVGGELASAHCYMEPAFNLNLNDMLTVLQRLLQKTSMQHKRIVGAPSSTCLVGKSVSKNVLMKKRLWFSQLMLMV